MLRTKSFIVILILFIIVIACRDNAVDPQNDLPEKTLSKIVTDSINYTMFTYSSNRLSKLEDIRNDVKILSISFNYLEDGRIESEEVVRSINNNEQRLYNYIYDNSKRLSKIEFLLRNGSSYIPESMIECFYNSQNQIIKTISTNISGTAKQETEYSYYSNGNTKEKVSYFNGDFLYRTHYKYDSSVNPANLTGSFEYNGLGVKTNNIVEVTSNTAFPERSYLTNYNYSYDDDGYPTKRVANYSDSDNNTFQKTDVYKYR